MARSLGIHATKYQVLCCVSAEVVFVGDSQRCDVDSPHAFGMQARWLDRRGGQTLFDTLAGVV
jgi:FMN phosphatase YigB (HAD superfamily)